MAMYSNNDCYEIHMNSESESDCEMEIDDPYSSDADSNELQGESAHL